jgi:NAD(P)-dependent dehydrogenase (short-subunit alcohol dehydrogenase family)
MSSLSNQIASRLKGRVVVVTGAGRGIGASYALLAGRHGAKVVVNDLGRGVHDEKLDETPADEVVRAIKEAGGEAISNQSDVSSFEGAKKLIDSAISTFGDVDVVINNAGILRDRMLVNMSEQEWDDVIRVHMKGHFCVSRHAASYWRDRSKIQPGRDAVLIQTSSIAGLHGNIGQVNYASAKSGIATMAHTIHLEMNARYGVRSYAIAPSARTRLTLSSPGAVEAVSRKLPSGFDFFDPDNVAPFVIWLAAEGCPAPSGSVFGVEGDLVRRYDSWRVAMTIRNGAQWTFDDLDRKSDELGRGSDRAFQPISEVTQI